jgi:hypothetical protein
MTAQSHTPLPWQIAEYGIRELKAKYICIKHGNKTIARIDASGNSLSVTKQDEANARLIVAAVNQAAKLAEALRECITEKGAMSERSHYNAKRRLQYITDTARLALAEYEAEQ